MLDDTLARQLFEVAVDPSISRLAHNLMLGVEARGKDYDAAISKLGSLIHTAHENSELLSEVRAILSAVERRRVQGRIRFDIHRLDTFVEDGWVCGDGFALLQDYLGYSDDPKHTSVRSAAQAWLQASSQDYDNETMNMFGWQEIVRAAACLCTDRSWIWRIAEIPLLRENLDHLCPLGLDNALSVWVSIKPSFSKDWIFRFDAGILHASMFETRNNDHGVLRIGHAVDCALSVSSMFMEYESVIRQIVEAAIFAVEKEVSK